MENGGCYYYLIPLSIFYILHLHVVDIIIIIRAWYYLFHVQEGPGGRRVFWVFCVSLLPVLRFRCWDVFNDTTTFLLPRGVAGFDSTIPTIHSHSRRGLALPQVSPGEKTQGKTNRCNLTWKPSPDKAASRPALPVLTRHDILACAIERRRSILCCIGVGGWMLSTPPPWCLKSATRRKGLRAR